MIIVPIFNNGLYPINYMCNVTLNRYHAEIFFCFVFLQKNRFFATFQASKNTVAFSKKLILALGERYKSVYRYVLCLNIIKFIN